MRERPAPRNPFRLYGLYVHQELFRALWGVPFRVYWWGTWWGPTWV